MEDYTSKLLSQFLEGSHTSPAASRFSTLRGTGCGGSASRGTGGSSFRGTGGSSFEGTGGTSFEGTGGSSFRGTGAGSSSRGIGGSFLLKILPVNEKKNNFLQIISNMS